MTKRAAVAGVLLLDDLGCEVSCGPAADCALSCGTATGAKPGTRCPDGRLVCGTDC